MATAPTRLISPTDASSKGEAWSRTDRAEFLGRQRPQLLRRLPFKVVGARDLPLHRREEVLDDAILYVAFEHSDPVYDEEVLMRVLWAACRLRVGSALRGRGDTVRGRFRAVNSDALATVAADGGDPAAIAEQRLEWETLLEFARQLEPLERAVVFKRYERAGAGKVHGYATIARELGEPEKKVRSALRSVQHKLDAYSLVIADRQSFERRLAGLLPAPIIAQPAVRPSGWRETLLDWLSRPFGHDTAATASTLAAGGGGRGIGALAVAVCLGGTAAGGGYCVITGSNPFALDPPKRTESRRAARAEPPARASLPARAQLAAERQAAAERRAAAQREAAERAAREHAAAQRIASRRRRVIARRAAARATPVAGSPADRREIQQDTRQAEQAPASPAPPSSSGNDFNFEQNSPTQPTASAAAPATGGGEFLP